MEVRVEEARLEQIPGIVLNLRSHERKFAEDYGVDVGECLQQLLRNSSIAQVGLADGSPVAMWGVWEKTLLGPNDLWLVTTGFVEENPKTFLRHSIRFVRRAREQYGTLYGYVSGGYTISSRWMEWLGFRPVRTVNDTIVYELKNGD